MSSIKQWNTGASACFYGKISEDIIKEFAGAGVACMELSFSHDYFYNELNFVNKSEEVLKWAENAGLELWSIHLPFSGSLDISHPKKEMRDSTMQIHTELLEAAAKAKVKVAVVHPSSEPILDSERPYRLENSKENLTILAQRANILGIRLAVEDLPRTCLGNCSDDILFLLKDNPLLKVCFDTNHLLKQDNVEFIKTIGNKIITLHVSDYDFIDERHQLPGEGKNNWNAILKALEDIGYNGPFLYEVSYKATPKHRVGPDLKPKDLKLNHQMLIDNYINIKS